MHLRDRMLTAVHLSSTARLESMTSLMNLGDTNRTVPPAPLAVRQSSTGAAGLSSITPGLYVIPSTDSKYSDG